MRAALVVSGDPGLHARLSALATQRMIFFAGLPGTGKSLLVHQLTHLAAAGGRVAHLLQWDVVRPVLEATGAGRRYPPQLGVSHAVIRKAAGLWARRAITEWAAEHRGPEHLVIGETPLVGNRFVELARPAQDAAEPMLAAPDCRFVIPVPSREVRAHLEAERERRAARPLHNREREDAPPAVLRGLWEEFARVAEALGVLADAREAPYDPRVYEAVYTRILSGRRVDVVPLDAVLPTEAFSVYDFAVECREVVPEPPEAERIIREVESAYADADALEQEVARWWAG